MKNFLYAFEDGSLKVGPKPTDDDIQAAEDGILSIVDMKKKQEFVPGVGWQDLEVIEIEDEDEDEMEFEEDYDEED